MFKALLMTKSRLLISIFTLFALLMIALAIVGGYKHYSPVPIVDVWDGNLNFFAQICKGSYTAWWGQHNEHRIVLAHALFWVDDKFFNGSSLFLIIVNYILVLTSVCIFWRILRAMTGTKKPSTSEILLGLFITAWLFQWTQSENFSWSFQSQFFLAQLLPLCAIFWLYKSLRPNRSRLAFFIACCFGLASVGSMANGILALPLMACYLLVMRQGIVRISILAMLAIISIGFYFHGYLSPPQHSTLLQALKTNPIGFIHYILLYLGNPFYSYFGHAKSDHFNAAVAAVFLIYSSTRFAIMALRQPQKATLSLALLTYIIYIGATAFGTAGGRLIFGVDQALASRYSTPALMAWVALLILYAPTLIATFKIKPIKILIPFTLLALLMINQQLKALESQSGTMLERNLSALALELGVADDNQIKYVYPNVDALRPRAEEAFKRNLSIFGLYPWHGDRTQLGTIMLQKPNLPTCRGYVDKVVTIGDDGRFSRVSGWIFNMNNKTHPNFIRFFNNQSKVIGFAFSGQVRPDLVNTIDPKALEAGYQGYLLTAYTGGIITLQGENLACQIQLHIPTPLFSTRIENPSLEQTTVSSTNISPGNQWLGADFSKSSINGFHVYGSLIHSDADIASIALQIKRGDKIFYRSGPTGGHQILEIEGKTIPPVQLPIAEEWTLLDFSSPALPKGSFTIKLSDNGANWGEWSAIAVKK